jgi:hypothetical protein
MESRFGEISGEQKSELEIKLLMQNLRREKLLSLILILVNVILLGLDAVATNLWTNENHIFGRYSNTHYLLLIIPAVFLIAQFLGHELQIKKLWYYRLAHWVLIGAVLFFCVRLSAHNEYTNKHLFAYITAMFCIAPLILLKKLEAYIIYISSLVLFLVSIKNITLNIDLIGDTFFLAILSILAIIISNINYSSFINGFAAQNTILEKTRH